jgi:glycosyltransferase involved in cell wall biosynthesis
MKDSLLLIMTPNISLEIWNKNGQLQRELNFYNKLCKTADLKLIIFSYGRNDKYLVAGQEDITVLEMPGWISKKLPFRLQNLIYHYSSLFRFGKYFRRVKFAKTNQFRASSFGILLKFIFQMPLIIRMGYYHSHLKRLNKSQKINEFFKFNYCDRIIVTSAEAAKFIVKSYKINDSKILSMCNAIDLEIFHPQKLKKQYDLMFVGRLEKVKNIELLLQSVTDIDLRVLIIGDGSLKELIPDAVKRNSAICWMQRVNNSDLPFYYNSSKVFIIQSEYEGNPKSLLEAMACGLPCIGTDVAGIRDCINNEYNGLLVDKDPDKIQKQIFTLLNDTFKAKTLGNNAVKWVKQECDMFKNIEREAMMYYSILNN